MVAKVGLTDARIKSLKSPSQGQAEVSDKIVPGLRIRIGKSGVKTYIFAQAREWQIKKYYHWSSHSALRFGRCEAKSARLADRY